MCARTRAFNASGRRHAFVENKYRLVINVSGALAVKHGWLGIGEIPLVSRRYFPRFPWNTRATARYGCGYPTHHACTPIRAWNEEIALYRFVLRAP